MYALQRLLVVGILWAISTWPVLWGAYGVIRTINFLLDRWL